MTAPELAAPELPVPELTRIRETGVAFDREEAALGLACVAAPIRYRGTAIAAVSVSGSTSCLDHGKPQARVQTAAAQISALYARQRAERSRPCA
jgi:DNA-binding IclR family transcriptional regulator